MRADGKRRVWAAVTVAALLSLTPPAGAEGEVASKQYDDGSFYEGTFKDGVPHGSGTYRLPNGYEYTGDWVEGRIEGQGRATYPNGAVYEGRFKNGKPDGKGTIIYADGGTYEGDWLGGEITGSGRAT